MAVYTKITVSNVTCT